MRLIDVDELEPHEIYDGHGFTEVVYMDDIREMSTVDAEPIRHGHWIGEGDGYADGEFVYDTWYCSNCDFVVEDDCEPDFKYCPNCGAKMDEVE